MGNVNSKKSYQTIFDDIFKSSIAIKKRTAKKTEKLLKYVVDEIFLPEFRKNNRFNKLYDHTYYTGSFYDGLRVNNAKEFDVNIVFKMSGESEFVPSSPGHANIYIHNDDGVLPSGELSTEFIKRWFEGLIDKTWVKTLNKTLIMNNQSYIMTRSKSGPASTIKVYSENELKFDLDLAPVFQALSGDCFLVPKPSDGDEYEWRLSYPHIERKLLDGKNIVKKAVKILKYLRDCQGWHVLSSYYIKTVAMHCLNGTDEENDLVLFLNESVELLKNSLANGKIPFYLLQKIGSTTLDQIRNRLVIILRKIREDPIKIYDYLYTPTTAQIESEPELERHSSSVDVVDSDEELEEISDHGLTTMEKIGIGAGITVGAAAAIGFGLMALFSKGNKDAEEKRK